MKKVVVIGLVLLLSVVAITAVGGYFWLNTQLQPVAPNSSEKVRFLVAKGASISEIAARLESEGLIKNTLVFRYVVKKEKLDQKIQAGTFVLTKGMTTREVAEQLTKGTEDEWVTILEGWRVEQVADAFADFPAFDRDDFLALAKPKEGYLFPDTYLFPKLVTAETVFSLLNKTFEKKTAELQAEATAKGVDFAEAVILASVIEREAQSLTDMKMVAGILYNRMEIGMPLQVDATLQYAKGYNAQLKDWWAPPLGVDKEIDSPYNTYKYPGLPPAPIANPSLNAMMAAVSPTNTEYFYYITDRQGNMRYAVGYEEHLQNINQYLR